MFHNNTKLIQTVSLFSILLAFFFFFNLPRCLLEIVSLIFCLFQNKPFQCNILMEKHYILIIFLKLAIKTAKYSNPLLSRNCFSKVQKLTSQNKVGVIHISQWHFVWPLSPKCFICIHWWKTKTPSPPPKKSKQYKTRL